MRQHPGARSTCLPRPMPKTLPLPPLERLNELFEVVPIDESQLGNHSGLMRKVSRGPAKAGSVAGSSSIRSSGRRADWHVRVDGKLYLVSRIIYYIVHKVDPGLLSVDHINRNHLDNNISNLRLADNSLQTHNQGRKSNNTSGCTGVSWHKASRAWRVRVQNKNQSTLIGVYKCKLEAAKAYNLTVLHCSLDKLGKQLNDLSSVSCSCLQCL